MDKKEILEKNIFDWSEGLKKQERESFSNAVKFIINELKVDERVLIPRPETEILVQSIVDRSVFEIEQTINVL